MNRLIICGSPRLNGRSASLANTIFEGCIAEFPDDEVQLVPISEIDVEGCMGCGGCNGETADGVRNATGENMLTDGEQNDVRESVVSRNGEISPSIRCVIDDDMAYIYESLDRADEAIVISPVYFSGAPSQLKAMLDRLQPYYVETASERDAAAQQGTTFKTAVKPLTLHIVGEGKSPHGYDALVSEVQSAFAVAGFRLEAIVNWVGKISKTGEIEGEAKMYALVNDDDGEANGALVGDGTNDAFAGDDDADGALVSDVGDSESDTPASDGAKGTTKHDNTKDKANKCPGNNRSNKRAQQRSHPKNQRKKC